MAADKYFMELFFQGAEAKLFRKGNAMLKERTLKKYRNNALDTRIRRERTKLEAGLIAKAGAAGINVPKIIQLDREKGRIEMEFIEGKRVKDILGPGNFLGICTEIGKAIAKMHCSKIIHGDLTTSNMLLQGKKLFFIDFGLGFQSKKTEDRAVDLVTFKKTFGATHHKLMPEAWEKILEAYKQENPEAESVFAQIEKVEKRGKYH